jgi:hypothetical protein
MTEQTGNTDNTEAPRPETRDSAVYRIVRDLVERGEDLTVREPRGPEVEALNLYLELAAEAQEQTWQPATAKERDAVTLAVRAALEAAAKAEAESKPEDDEQQKPAEPAQETPPEPPPPPQPPPKARARAPQGAARDQAPEPSAYPTMLYAVDGRRSTVSDNAAYQRARGGGFRLLDEYPPEQRRAIIEAGGLA